MLSTQHPEIPQSTATNAYDLLTEIRELIREEPKRYNQQQILQSPSPSEPLAPACGTVGCVAGWVYVLRTPPAQWGERFPMDIAAHILGLTPRQADELFGGRAVGWMPQTWLHAALGRRHIRRFQKRYAQQLRETALKPRAKDSAHAEEGT